MKRLALLLLYLLAGSVLIGMVTPRRQTPASPVVANAHSPQWEDGHAEGGFFGAFLSVHSPNTPTEEQIRAVAAAQGARKRYPVPLDAGIYAAGFRMGFMERFNAGAERSPR